MVKNKTLGSHCRPNQCQHPRVMNLGSNLQYEAVEVRALNVACLNLQAFKLTLQIEITACMNFQRFRKCRFILQPHKVSIYLVFGDV